MKKIITSMLVTALCAFSMNLYAEEEKKDAVPEKIKPAQSNGYEEPQTLFKSGNMRFSGYGAPEVQFCYMDGQIRVFLGGRGGLIINDQFVIGGAGYGMASSLTKSIDGEEKKVDFGYGGLLLEYYFFPKSLLHFSIGTLVAGGGVGTFRHGRGDSSDDLIAQCFVLQPEINLFVNIAKFCRMGIGANYHFVAGMDKEGLSNEDFSGFSGTIMVQFGWF